MKSFSKLVFSYFLILYLPSFSQPTDLMIEETEAEPFQFGVRAESVFPIFTGPGIFIRVSDEFEASAYYGLTPETYYTTIGTVAASTGGNSAYADVIRAAFQNNSILKVSGVYKPLHWNWNFGVSSYMIAADGSAGIDTVLSAATGRDYSTLKNALTAAGRSTQVQLKSALVVFEIHAKHIWKLQSAGELSLGFGFAKVMNSKVNITTGLALFDSTTAGQNIISQSETDLQSIIQDNGMTPTLSLGYDYIF